MDIKESQFAINYLVLEYNIRKYFILSNVTQKSIKHNVPITCNKKA